jgi:hypothetical protein
MSGQCYLIGAARNVRKRINDNLVWLDAGTHHCRILQRAWSVRADDHRIYLVERLSVPWLIPVMKQHWMDKLRAVGKCLNHQSAMRVKRPRRRVVLPYPPILLDEPLTAAADFTDAFLARYTEAVSLTHDLNIGAPEDAVGGGIEQHRARAEAAMQWVEGLLRRAKCRQP